MSIGFLFPGQGTQFVGMAKDFYKQNNEVYKVLFEEANDILGIDLKELCFFGPKDKLTITEIAQPAILTSSIGVYRLLESEGISPDFVAGHSVGQFSALVAAGTLTFSDALKIVHQRGKSMSAVKRQGTMVAVVTSKEEQLDEIVELSYQYDVDMAAHNSPTQMVFSGEVEKIVEFQKYVDPFPGVKAKLLNVSQGFHSRLMQEMEQEFMEYISQFSVNDATIPVILNCSAKATTNKDKIIEDIRLQCTQAVLWKQTIEQFSPHETHEIFEVGSSKTLIGLLRAFSLTGITTFSTETIMSYKKSVKKYTQEFKKTAIQS